MKSVNKATLRKFLYAYVAAVILVVLYFIGRIILQDERPVEYKSFKAPAEALLTEPVQEQEPDEARRFILMPKQ